jgi:antitoxin (DNA-binding transcriptional repressor) of toxin-antitoxin stability system
MKFIAVKDLQSDPAKVWKALAQEKELILTENGKPFALLTPLSDAGLEREADAFRQTRALNALRSLQAASVAAGTDNLSMEAISALIAKAREGRRAGVR